MNFIFTKNAFCLHWSLLIHTSTRIFPNFLHFSLSFATWYQLPATCIQFIMFFPVLVFYLFVIGNQVLIFDVHFSFCGLETYRFEIDILAWNIHDYSNLETKTYWNLITNTWPTDGDACGAINIHLYSLSALCLHVTYTYTIISMYSYWNKAYKNVHLQNINFKNDRFWNMFVNLFVSNGANREPWFKKRINWTSCEVI